MVSIHGRVLRTFASCCLEACCALAVAGAEAGEGSRIKGEIAASRLELAGAVAATNLSLNAGLARFDLYQGVLVPASPIGGKVVEMVFLGSGRVSVAPPDRAFRRLHGGIFSDAVDSTEGQLLLAIAAQATGRKDELAAALKAVKASGADVALLTAK